MRVVYRAGRLEKALLPLCLRWFCPACLGFTLQALVLACEVRAIAARGVTCFTHEGFGKA